MEKLSDVTRPVMQEGTRVKARLIPVDGALFVITSGFFFALMSVAVKFAAQDLPSVVIVFFRNAVGLLFLLPLLGMRGRELIRTTTLRFHILRALAGLAAMTCFFYAISRLSLTDAVLLNYTLPLFMPLIGWVWLKEKIPPVVFAAIAVGFLGVGLIIKPTSNVFDPVALVGLAAGILGALAQVTIRRLTKTEPISRIVFYFALFATVVSAIPLIFTDFSLILSVFLILVAVGFLATLGQIFLTKGYASAPAGIIGPFIYSSVVFAAFLEWLIWGLLPDIYSLIGALLICLGGILTLVSRERN